MANIAARYAGKRRCASNANTYQHHTHAERLGMGLLARRHDKLTIDPFKNKEKP
jgi:hypothetical protein